MYAYVQSDSSVMRTSFKEQRVHDTIDVYDEVYAFFKEKGTEELNQKILIRYLSYCVELAQKTKASTVIDNKEKVYQFLTEKWNQKTEEAKQKIGIEKYKYFNDEFHKVMNTKG